MQPEQAVALVAGPKGRWAGLAFLVGPRRLVTCAHVVNTALSRDRRTADVPGTGDTLRLMFPFGPQTAGLFEATVERWLQDGDWRNERDLAVLALDHDAPELPHLTPVAPPPGTTAVQLCGPSDGNRLSHVLGELVGSSAPGLRQINQHGGNAYRVAPGFSGGPVWLPGTGEVVGVLRAMNPADDASDAECVDLVILDAEEPDGGYVLDPDRRGLEGDPFDLLYDASVRRLLGPGMTGGDVPGQRRILDRLRLEGRRELDPTVLKVRAHLVYLRSEDEGFDIVRKERAAIEEALAQAGLADTVDALRLEILWSLLGALDDSTYQDGNEVAALLADARTSPDVDPLDRAELYVLHAGRSGGGSMARKSLWHAWRIRRATLGADAPITLVTKAFMHMVTFDGEPATGDIDGFTTLLPKLDELFGGASRAMVAIRVVLTTALLETGRTTEAIQVGRANLAAADEAFGAYDDLVLDARSELATALIEQNHADEFIDAVGPGIHACLSELELYDIHETARYLAERYVERDDYDAAIGTLRSLAERLVDIVSFGPDHEVTREVRQDLAEFERDRGILRLR